MLVEGNQHQPEAKGGRRGGSQCLGVDGEAGEADVELAVDLEGPLEVGGDGLQLHTEVVVTGDGEAVLPHHLHHGGAVVLEDLRGGEGSGPSGGVGNQYLTH